MKKINSTKAFCWYCVYAWLYYAIQPGNNGCFHRNTSSNKTNIFFMLIFLPCYLSEFLCPFLTHSSSTMTHSEGAFRGHLWMWIWTHFSICYHMYFRRATRHLYHMMWKNNEPTSLASIDIQAQGSESDHSFCFPKTLNVDCFASLVVSFKKFSS